ncbi:MAG: ribonuclease H-like domain-containing protein, partial [Candidatus Promineifilaceae bacterium]
LLPLSRRLWKKRIGSCSLNSLEKRVLGLRRSEEDVPGWMIPGMYMDYLRTGDATDLLRVFYHNRIDMLSMIVLSALVNKHLSQPDDVSDPLDLLSLAMWQNSLGMINEAETTLRQVTDREISLDQQHLAWRELGLLLKRAGRREEAAVHWRQIAVTHVQGMSPDSIALEAHVELAKYFEWHVQDLKEARSWTKQAISIVEGWSSARSTLAKDELKHRLTRLERKLNRDEDT